MRNFLDFGCGLVFLVEFFYRKIGNVFFVVLSFDLLCHGLGVILELVVDSEGCSYWSIKDFLFLIMIYSFSIANVLWVIAYILGGLWLMVVSV